MQRVYPPMQGYEPQNGRREVYVRKSWSPLSVICCCLFLLLLVLLVILGIFILVAVLIIRPTSPNLSLKSLQITKLALSLDHHVVLSATPSSSGPLDFSSSIANFSSLEDILTHSALISHNTPTSQKTALLALASPPQGSNLATLNSSITNSSLLNNSSAPDLSQLAPAISQLAPTASSLVNGSESAAAATAAAATSAAASALAASPAASAAIATALGDLSAAAGAASADLTVYMNVTLNARNPNDFTLYYEKINVTVEYHGTNIGKANLSPFSQPSHSNTTIPINVNYENAPIPVDTALSLGTSFQGGHLNLTALIGLTGHIRIWGIAFPSVKANVTCNLTISTTSQQVDNRGCQLQNVGIVL